MGLASDKAKTVSGIIGKVGKVSGYVEVSPFNYTDLTWKGCSRLLACFHYSVARPFTFKVNPQFNGNLSFVLAVRYRRDTKVLRYKLFKDVGEVLYCPLYDGHKIYKNFILEVWSTNGTTATLLTNMHKLKMSTKYVAVPMYSVEDILECESLKFDNELYFDLPANLNINQSGGITGIDNETAVQELLASGDWETSTTKPISL